MNGETKSGGQGSDFPSGPRPGERHTTFFEDPMIDHLLRAVVTLTMELSVTRERLKTVEALLAENGAVPADKADDHQPDPADNVERGKARMKLIDDVLGPMADRLSSS